MKYSKPMLILLVIAFSFVFGQDIINDIGSDGEFIVKNPTDSLMVIKGDNGNVGIGTTSPGWKLTISGDQAGLINPNGNASFRVQSTGGGNADLYLSSQNESRIYWINNNGTKWYTRLSSGNDLLFYNFSLSEYALKMFDEGKFTIYPSGGGNVGIGTDNPTAKLEVAGQVKLTGGTPGAGKVLTSDATGLATWETPSTGGSSLWTEGTDDKIYRSSGNVGIGTNNPIAKLDVNGDIYMYNGLLRFYKSYENFGNVLNFRTKDNNHFGDFRFEAEKTETSEVKELLFIDGDNGNVGIGTSNPAFGLDLKGNFRIISSGDNDGQFQFKLIGDQEAYFIMFNGNNYGLIAKSDGNSPKLGTYTGGSLHIYPYSDRTTLDTAKGALATYDFADMNVGIGTDNPTAKLEVAGQVKITGGTPGAGKVLTSDASGLGTWETPSTGGSSLWTESGGNVYRSNGNVGVGTSNPTAKLDINGRATASISFTLGTHNDNYRGLVVDNGASYGWTLLRLMNINGEHFRINGNGNVGIGTTNPTAKLEVAGMIHSTSGGIKFPDGSVQTTANGGTSVSPWSIVSGGIQYDNNVGIGYSHSGFKLLVNGSTRLMGPLYDSVNSNGNDGQVLKSTGNGIMWVDINTNPTTSVSTTPRLSGDGSTSSSLDIAQMGAGAGQILKWNGSAWAPGNDETGEPNTGDNDWSISGSNMYSGVAGNVGIGTNSPTGKLDINGTLRLRGHLYDYNNSTGTNGQVLTRTTNGIDWQDASSGSLWESNGSNVYRSSGSVGIGTTSPSGYLDVQNSESRFYFNMNSGGEVGLNLQRKSNGRKWLITGPRVGNDNLLFSYYNGSSWKQTLNLTSLGFVGIGTENPTHKLSVNGTIRAKEVIVNTNWSDFVFKDNYKLPTLNKVEQYINEHGHLPGIPSEAEVLENGVSLGEMQAKLLQKIEELTLYMIELKKENKRLESIVLNVK